MKLVIVVVDRIILKQIFLLKVLAALDLHITFELEVFHPEVFVE